MQFKVEHRIGVPAPSTVIWDVLSDLGRWHEWNPVYPEVSGLLRIAQKLTIKETFPGVEPRVITPMIIDWVPNEQILWTTKEAGGLVKRIRYIEIEHLTDEDKNCYLSNGEVFDGWLGPRQGKKHKFKLRAGFEALNHAVAERVRKVMAGEAIAAGDRG
jgi:hypothetical protein